ncbi:hypothetical protein PG993_005724 [Apiospora rasikravindrae]|uniref:Uncharacterized protein n=1 Tax=Apiospora rasikravindrae TaxID=990691 RepID=A0ABR1TBX4_9PEZI
MGFCALASLLDILYYPDARFVGNVLLSIDPDDRPPELVRMYLLLRYWNLYYRPLGRYSPWPCSCHLDGLLTNTFKFMEASRRPEMDSIDSRRVSASAECAEVLEAEPRDWSTRDRGGTVTTLNKG